MIPGRSPTKIVQTVPVGCISRLQGQKIGFQNAIFKNLLVWNYKAQRFHIWYIASKLFKLSPWGRSQFYIELYKKNCKKLLLLNRLWEFDKTKQEWSLGGSITEIVQMVLIGCIS